MQQKEVVDPGSGESWFEPSSCLYCSGENLDPWLDGIRDRLGHVDGTWSFLKCRSCGSAHISPMPRPEIVPDLYPSVYSFRPDFDSGSKAKGIIARLEEKLFYNLIHKGETNTVKRHTGLTSGAMLDVGCGTGDRLVRYDAAGFQVRGMDIQPELADYVHTRLGFEVDAGTLDTVSYPPDSFDIVTADWVIEHLLDVRAVLEKIYAMLKPGGWVVAEVPLADSFQAEKFGARMSQFSEAPRHVSIPSQKGAMLAFTSCGFTDVKIVPSSAMDCASFFALSLVPSAAATHVYNNSSLATHLPRFAAGAVTFLYLPGIVVENRIIKRPAAGLVFGRKPL